MLYFYFIDIVSKKYVYFLDIVSKMYLKEFLNKIKSDYIWRKISQNFVSKIPSNSLDSFITNVLLQIPW